MKGDAKRAIEGLEVTEENFKEAMEILEDAFLAKGLIAEKSSWVRKHDPKGGQDDMPVYAMTAANETTFSEFRK